MSSGDYERKECKINKFRRLRKKLLPVHSLKNKQEEPLRQAILLEKTRQEETNYLAATEEHTR